MKQLVKYILPHGIVRLVQTRQERGYQRGRAAIQGKNASVPPIAHTALIDFVVSRGVDRTQAREGTMPEASLAFLASILALLFGLLFVTQPLEVSPNDDAAWSVLSPMLATLTGGLLGVLAGNGLKDRPKDPPAP